MSHCLKRLTLSTAIAKALQFSPLFNKSAISFLLSLRRSLSTVFRFMDSVFSRDDDDLLSSPFDRPFFPPAFTDPGESIYLVSLRWWQEAVRGGGDFVFDGGFRGVLYNATAELHDFGSDGGGEDCDWGVFGESDIFVDLRREGEAGISGEEGGVEDLALVAEWMFFTALKWHFDNKFTESSLPGEDTADNLFSLNISLVYMTETERLAIKISAKNNGFGALNKASRIFLSKSGMFQLWDFSGQMNELFVHDNQSSTNSYEIVQVLQIYGLPYNINVKETRNGDMMMKQPRIDSPSSSSSFMVNGSVDRVPLSFGARSGLHGSTSLGLTGLQNLGNTCFMNSAIQCLAHTPKLVDYFLGNFRKDLNHGNPLGMSGKLAIAFGDLLRKLWTPGAASVAPSMLKSTISSFAPQFNGYHQHDSQELLSFLLDGLHEDLNRVKRKPYIQAKEDDDRSDEEVADEYWKNHVSRNDSIIVDLCQGQYRSSLVCPDCKKLSVTFDPFMYLSLPLPSSAWRKLTLTIFSTDETNLPHPVTITVPNSGTSKDLVEAVALACSLRNDETLLIAEIFNNAIFRILDEPSDSLELIRDYDRLVAYRLPKDMDGAPLVVFMHKELEKSCNNIYSSKKFGIPLVARISDFSKGSGIYKEFLKLINPFLLPKFLMDDDASRTSVHEDEKIVDTVLDEASESKNELKNHIDAQTDFEFHLETGSYSSRRIEMNEPVDILKSNQKIEVFVTWSEKMIQEYDTTILSILPEVCKERTQDTISLYECVDAFLREEPLGPDDMWYCPNCKVHRQASKKLDLWRLPEILVVHLKRFSYTKYWKNKLETFVDFPIDDFDLSNHVTQKSKEACNRYMLYAISNHYGGMGGGHYTAFAKHKGDRWYEFDDSGVFLTHEERIKNQAAYLLFYKRI